MAGLLQQELNKADPSVVDVDKAIAEASRTLVTTGTGTWGLDPTLGNAFKLAALKESLLREARQGRLGDDSRCWRWASRR